MSEILGVVQLVLEVDLGHLEEGQACKERVGAGLVLRALALDLEHVGHLLQAALQVLARLHQVLEVVDVREVELEVLEKLGLALGQVLVGEDAEKVAEVVAAVERQPLDVVEQNDPWYNSDTQFRWGTS